MTKKYKIDYTADVWLSVEIEANSKEEDEKLQKSKPRSVDDDDDAFVIFCTAVSASRRLSLGRLGAFGAFGRRRRRRRLPLPPPHQRARANEPKTEPRLEAQDGIPFFLFFPEKKRIPHPFSSTPFI